jgi:hypothetical protein
MSDLQWRMAEVVEFSAPTILIAGATDQFCLLKANLEEACFGAVPSELNLQYGRGLAAMVATDEPSCVREIEPQQLEVLLAREDIPGILQSVDGLISVLNPAHVYFDFPQGCSLGCEIRFSCDEYQQEQVRQKIGLLQGRAFR